MKILREDSDREAIVTDVVLARPFGDADKLLLAWGDNYRLEKPDQLLVRLKVEHSGFVTLNNQSFSSNFIEEAGPFWSREKGDGQEGESKPHIPILFRR